MGELFGKVLKFLVDKAHLQKLPLPWGPTDQRHIVTNEASPTHPSGRPFFYPVKYDGYAIESHYSRERALQVLGELCQKLEISFEVIET